MLETGVPLYQGIVFSKKSAIQTNVFSLVGLLGFASQKVQKHTFCYTHYITIVYVLNGFQQVPVVVSCVNNVINPATN